MNMVEWSPMVHVSEEQNAYRMKAWFPGVKRENIRLMVDRGVLTAIGECKSEEETGHRYHRIDRPSNRYERGFILPPDADPNQIQFEFEDNFLSICLLKFPTSC
jgi:HSP20 family protein